MVFGVPEVERLLPLYCVIKPEFDIVTDCSLVVKPENTFVISNEEIVAPFSKLAFEENVFTALIVCAVFVVT